MYYESLINQNILIEGEYIDDYFHITINDKGKITKQKILIYGRYPNQANDLLDDALFAYKRKQNVGRN